MAFLDETGATILANEVKTYVGNTAVAKEDGKGLSTNDYTTTEKNKLAGIAEGANKTIVDSVLDVSSENPVQNKVVKEQIDALTTQINNAIALRSSLEQYGMAKLSNSAAVTDSTGLALPATEKNATIEGTLANQIAQLNTNYENGYMIDSSSCLPVEYGENLSPYSDIDQVRCVKSISGLRCITGSIAISEDIEWDKFKLIVPETFGLDMVNYPYQKWINAVEATSGKSHVLLFWGTNIIGWGNETVEKGNILSIYCVY